MWSNDSNSWDISKECGEAICVQYLYVTVIIIIIIIIEQ